MMHLYAFTKNEADPRAQVLERASAALGTDIPPASASCREVKS